MITILLDKSLVNGKSWKWIRQLAAAGLLSWLASAGAPAQAQIPWQKDAVLSQLLIYQLVQDSDGFMWAATDEGVYRYDGYKLVPLSELVRPSRQLPASPCRLALGRHGDLWILFDRHLYRYSTRQQTLTAIVLPQLAADYPTLNLAADSTQDRLWVSSTAHTVVALTLSQGRLVPGSARQLAQPLVWLRPAPHGQVWVGTQDRRIICLGGSQPQRIFQGPTDHCIFPVPGTEPQQFASACAQYAAHPDGRLYEVRRWLPAQGSDDSESSLFTPELQAGNVQWVVANHIVQLRQRPGSTDINAVSSEAVRLDDVDGYGSRFLGQVFTDALGTEWVFSASYRGCYRRHRAAYLQPLATAQQWYSSRAICQLPDQRLLVSSYAGLLVQAAGQPTAPLQPWLVWRQGQPVQPVFGSVLLLGPHHLLATEDRLSLLDLRSRQLRYVGSGATGSLAPPPTVLLPAGNGRVWVGTRAGLFWLSKAELWLHECRAWPARQWPRDIRALALDPQTGALWVATTAGLYQLDERRGRIRHFAAHLPAPHALPTNELLSLQANGARVWVGTRDQGALLVDAQRGLLRQLTVADGLPSATVCSLLADDRHHLWLGTYAGVAHYQLLTGQLDVFTTANGLADNECNYQSGFRDTAGRLYFGSIKGVTRFMPHHLRGANSPRRRLLVSRYAFYPGATDTLSRYSYPTQRALPAIRLLDYDQATVKVALTDYTSPETTHYQYRLLGLADTTWHRTVPQQTVRLLDIPVGDYVIQIRASSQAGLPARNEVRIPLRVRRTWWRHPGVGAAAVLLLLGGTYLTVRRSRWWQQQQQQQLRRRLAHDLHDELGALLVRASLQAEHLRHVYPLTGPATNSLIGNIQAATQAIRDIVWGIDPHHNTVGDLLDRMRQYLEQSTAHLVGPQVTFQADGLKATTTLSPLLRQHLYAIFKEAVTNSLRHAQHSTSLSVSLTYESQQLVLLVRDDGHPTADSSRRGVGLRSMQQRAQAMGGQLSTKLVGPLGGFEVCLLVSLRT